MSKLSKHLTLFLIGGIIYIMIETIWRKIFGSHPTHWTMFLMGGGLFLILGELNEFLSWETPFWFQCLIGDFIVLTAEFIAGCILNLWLGLDVWDYSNSPFNILGQVCLSFAAAWYALSAVAIVLDDYLRYWLFGEEKPHYYWHFNKNNNEMNE